MATADWQTNQKGAHGHGRGGAAAGTCESGRWRAVLAVWCVWTSSTGSMSQAAVTEAGRRIFPRLRRKNDRNNGVSSMMNAADTDDGSPMM